MGALWSSNGTAKVVKIYVEIKWVCSISLFTLLRSIETVNLLKPSDNGLEIY